MIDERFSTSHFIDQMRMIAFGASETRYDYSLQEVCDEILERSNELQAIKESLDRFSASQLLVLFNEENDDGD